jgi:hypothetical protein
MIIYLEYLDELLVPDEMLFTLSTEEQRFLQLMLKALMLKLKIITEMY